MATSVRVQSVQSIDVGQHLSLKVKFRVWIDQHRADTTIYLVKEKGVNERSIMTSALEELRHVSRSLCEEIDLQLLKAEHLPAAAVP